MRVFRKISEYKGVISPVVTIGTFDGVHKGHRQVLQQLKNIAKELDKETLVITFWPHPRQILSPLDDRPKLLTNLDNKIKHLQELGIDNLLIIPFDKEFSKQKPDQFIEELIVNRIKASAVVIGYDHRFGQNRAGSFSYLKEKADIHNYQVFEVSALQVGGLSVSSTKIRKALKEGMVNKANEYLGYTYSIEGTVISGLKLGTKLDFPTANIKQVEDEKLLPFDGVYVVEVKVNNELHYGMLNNGVNPTVPEKGRSIEVFIFDFEGDIYQQAIEIGFLIRLRDEMFFPDLQSLKAQLEIDKMNALRFLQQMK